MQDESIGRRDFVKAGAIAGAGAAIAPLVSATVDSASAMSGLAAEYGNYDGLGLAELIAKKKISPLELLNAVRQKAEALNPKLNAFTNLFFDKAEAQIKQGLPAGPFHGVPFALKDLTHHLAGEVTSSGSRVFKGFVPDFDSTIVARHKQAGLVIFAKTSTPELGLVPSTEPALFGKCHNPWNLELTPGGSSGGAAAVVASRILPMASATDGGGSIRVPASCCGIFGLKPTRARVPTGPSALEGWNGFSASHAVTISVRDSAALLDATAGAELGSPYWAPPVQRPFAQEVGASPGALRIAVVVKAPTGVPVDTECVQAATDAAKLCETLGHSIEEVTLPVDGPALNAARRAVIAVSTARTLEDAAKLFGRMVTEQDVEPVTWAYYQEGLRTSSVAYSRGIAYCQQVGLAIARFQQKYDVILSPTLAKPPLPLGVLSPKPDGVDEYYRQLGAFMPFTALYSAIGAPSMSVPLHWTATGIPIGVMFSARFGDEATLFRLAAQLEKAKPWAGRKPNV